MAKFDKRLIRDYRSLMVYIERVVSSVHGTLNKDASDQRDKLESQLVNRGLSHILRPEDLENYHYHHNSV